MVKDIANSEVEEWKSHTRKLDMVTSSRPPECKSAPET